MKSTEELLLALKTIKETCEKFNNKSECYKCPFGGTDGDCLIIRCSPDNWIVEETTKLMTSE